MSSEQTSNGQIVHLVEGGSSQPGQMNSTVRDLDINTLLGVGRGSIFKVEPDEHDEDRRNRLSQATADAWVRRGKEVVVFLLGCGAAGWAFILSARYMETGTGDDKAWARTIFSSILTGVVAYLVGKQENK